MGDELGPIKYSPDTGAEAYYGMGGPEYSQKTAELIDREIKKLIDQAYAKVTGLIEANRDKMKALTDALLKYETLDFEDVKIILEGGSLDKPTVADLLKAEQDKAQAEKSLDDDYDIYAEAGDWGDDDEDGDGKDDEFFKKDTDDKI